MAPQDSENCGRDFAKRKQTDADFAANNLLRMVIIDIAINVLLSRVTGHPAGMHCPARDDAFVSSHLCVWSFVRKINSPSYIELQRVEPRSATLWNVRTTFGHLSMQFFFFFYCKIR